MSRAHRLSLPGLTFFVLIWTLIYAVVVTTWDIWGVCNTTNLLQCKTLTNTDKDTNVVWGQIVESLFRS